MVAIVRWPLMPILLIGLLNVPAWYGLSFWGLDWRLALTILIGLAFTAGWYTQEKAWGTVLALLAPTMFIGGEHHGRPWQWLVYGFLHPSLWSYVLLNLGPVVAAYSFLVWAGRVARAKLTRRH